jgi:hypothetical protein
LVWVVVVVEDVGGAIGMGCVVVVVLLSVEVAGAAGGGLTTHPPKTDALPNSKRPNARRTPALLMIIFVSPVGD